jgi:hypothetical protein
VQTETLTDRQPPPLALEPAGLLTLSRLRDNVTGQFIHMAHCTICKSARHFGAWEDALDFITQHVTTHWAN